MQVFSLLILKNFFPPQESGLGGISGIGSPFASVNSTELLASQLNSFLSNKYVNLNLHYQPASAVSPLQAQVAASTELAKGRVIINTDVGTMTGVTENTNNIVGEVTVEYKLSKDGKLRVKAFNKANENTSIYLLNSEYTQGAGVSYHEEFNNFGELIEKIKNKFRHKHKTDGQKTDTDSGN
jgi:hypothetical protein